MEQTIEDVKIVEELKKDTSNGTKLLFEKYYDKLKKHGKSYYYLSEEDIEELVDDTIIDAYQKINCFEFNNGKGFSAWIFRIFKNNIIDFLKHKKLSISYFDENIESDESEYFNLVDTNKEVEKIIIDLFSSTGIKEDDRKNIIYEIFEEFKNDEKEGLWLYFNGIPHNESSQYRKMKEEAYRKRVSRLLQSFFQIIGQKLNKDGKQIYEEYKKQNR